MHEEGVHGSEPAAFFGVFNLVLAGSFDPSARIFAGGETVEEALVGHNGEVSRVAFEDFFGNPVGQVFFGSHMGRAADGPRPAQGSRCAPSLTSTGHGPECRMGLQNFYAQPIA